MANLPPNLPALLRSEGLKVVEHGSWRKRGRPGSFRPVGVLCHHTATYRSTPDRNVLTLLTAGRSDLPGPLCQIGLARDGTVYLIAAGRANHAGRAKSSGTVAAGDGNSLYIGIEAFNDGRGEKWPAAQYDAYVTLAAALCKHVTGNSAQTVRGHKETSVTGKIDPTFPMGAFRTRVAAELRGSSTPAPGGFTVNKQDEKTIENIVDRVITQRFGGNVNARTIAGNKKKVPKRNLLLRIHNMVAEILNLVREIARGRG